MKWFVSSAVGSLWMIISAFLSGAAEPAEKQAIPVDSIVPFSPSPVRAEGRTHLLYELHLTDFGRIDLHLLRVDVFGSHRTVLQSISGKALRDAAYQPGAAAGADPAVLASGRRTILFMDVIVPEGPTPPAMLRHRLTFAPVRTINLDEQTILDLPPVAVSARNPPLLGPPLRGGCWVASHALSNASSHRRTVIALAGRAYDAQRFAIDWIRIGADGQAFRGDAAQNRNWSAYGAPVLAVSDGVVAEAQDGIPENDPTAERKAVPITLSTVGGNHVLLDVGDGFSVFYAHLQPGSVKVHAGQRVRWGQVIGRIGNSGQADAPHLHMHVVAGESALASEGVPARFASFSLQGHLPSLSVLANGQGWKPAAKEALRKGEMPVENAVVAFPNGPSSCAGH